METWGMPQLMALAGGFLLLQTLVKLLLQFVD